MEELIIRIPENFAVNKAIEFKDRMLELIEEGNVRLKMDFGGCEFIDSTGIGVLVTIYKKLNDKNGYMRMKAINEQVMRVLNLTRLDNVFDIIK